MMLQMEQSERVDLKTWVAFISMVFGMFMAVLDIQIVASSLKEIQAGLSATQDEINWVQSSYLIAEVAIIPIAGWLTKVFSTRILFSISCAGFTLMSLACAFAWNLDSMIVFRAFQGFFGGAMIPTVFATIFILFPLSYRSSVTVVVGLVVTMAPITGPVLGGYITEYLSWNYLFLLNLIPGVLVTLSVLKLVDFDKPRYELLKNIDLIGILLIIVCLGSLQYVIEEGVREEWFESNLIIMFSSISLVAGVSMIYHELTTDHPVINLYAFRDRNFFCSCILSFILGWGLFSAVFILPIYLGAIKGLNSLQIGEYLFVMGVFQFLSAPCAGILSKKLDLRVILAIGFILFGFGCLLNNNITYESGFFDFFLAQAVRGFALMFCFLPITTLAFATLPKDEIQTASGLYNLMRNLGGAIGLAISNTWLQNLSKENYSYLRENVDFTNQKAQDYLSILDGRFFSFDYVDSAMASLKVLYQVAQREAYVITFNQVFTYISFLFFVTVLFVVPFIKGEQTTKVISDKG
jgi:MFS transporter, DHA2 family, multidrug resistance protein